MASRRLGGDAAEQNRRDNIEEILALLPREERERLRRQLELVERASVLAEDRCFARHHEDDPDERSIN